MEIIKEVLMAALDANLSYVVLMDIVIGFLYLFNIILGTIIGTKESRFDLKKFLFGVLKAICILLIVIGLCYILNVFTLTLNKLSGFITISTDLVSTIEVLSTMVTIGLDIAKECIDKASSIRTLRYVSPEDVVVNDTNVVEPIEFKG